MQESILLRRTKDSDDDEEGKVVVVMVTYCIVIRVSDFKCSLNLELRIEEDTIKEFHSSFISS